MKHTFETDKSEVGRKEAELKCDDLVLPINGSKKRMSKADRKRKVEWNKCLKSLHAQMKEARGPESTLTLASLKPEIDIQKALYLEKNVIYPANTRDVNEMQPE